LAISLFILSFYYYILYIFLGVFWFLNQFIGIYQDYTNFEKHRTRFLEVGFLGSLWGGIHYNARLAYNVNSVWAISGILFRIFLGFLPYFEVNLSEIPVIVLLGLSSALNFYAGMRAIPPRLQEEIHDIYKRNCRNAIFRYLKQNRGKAFSINALKKRIDDLGLKFEEKEFYKEHIQEVLNSLIVSENIESTVQNEEVYYLVP
jgi:hypothetical protein